MEDVKTTFYHEPENKLTVTFSGGSVFDFHPVTPDSYADIIKSDCLSRAVHTAIRHGNLVGVRRIEG